MYTSPLFTLLRGEPLAASADWEALFREAVAQGVVGLAYDRLGAYRPPRAVVLRWAATVAQMERRYRRYSLALRHLQEFYASHDIPCLVLKGHTLAQLWPVPDHRPVGDIDIYLYGRQREADQLMAREKGITIDTGHHHHTVFPFEGEMVENHYDFLNVHSHRSTPPIEARLKALASAGDLPLLHLLFVCRHAAIHFAANSLTLRQALDWAFLARTVRDEATWRAFYADARRMGMTPFVATLNALCTHCLGFPPATFPLTPAFNERLLRRTVEDILHPLPLGVGKRDLPYLLHRLRLWPRMLWKHRMVYTDSPLSTFLHGLWAHLLKPRSIVGR